MNIKTDVTKRESISAGRLDIYDDGQNDVVTFCSDGQFEGVDSIDTAIELIKGLKDKGLIGDERANALLEIARSAKQSSEKDWNWS